MGFQDLGPVLGGLLKSSADQREINRDDAQRQQQREDSIFNALANSDDPEVRAAAVTGLLHNDHPGTFFDKFFQKHRANPSFDHIKSLVANGHQPMVGESEQTRLHAQNQTQGTAEGRTAAIRGSGLSPERQDRAIMAGFGGAERQPANGGLQAGGFYRDGKFVANGFWDPQNRTFFNEDNTPNEEEGLQFIPAGKGVNGGSAKTGPPPDPNKIVWDKGIEADTGQYGTRSPGGWIVGHNPTTGEKVRKPAQQSQSFSPFQTTGGAAPFNNRTGQFGAVRPDLAAPTPPAAASNALQSLVARLERTKPQHGLLATSPASPAQMARWQADADAAAKAQGFENFGALQAAAGETTRGMVGGVAPALSAPTEPPPVPPGGGAGARGKPAAPTKSAAPPAAATGADATAGPADDPLNVLQHLR